MKCKFTALGVLAGWYLMVPPSVFGPKGEIVIADAPVSRWKVLHVYDAANACDREMLRERAQDNKTEDNTVSCIATNDPRLAN